MMKSEAKDRYKLYSYCDEVEYSNHDIDEKSLKLFESVEIFLKVYAYESN